MINEKIAFFSVEFEIVDGAVYIAKLGNVRINKDRTNSIPTYFLIFFTSP